MKQINKAEEWHYVKQIIVILLTKTWLLKSQIQNNGCLVKEELRKKNHISDSLGIEARRLSKTASVHALQQSESLCK